MIPSLRYIVELVVTIKCVSKREIKLTSILFAHCSHVTFEEYQSIKFGKLK